MNERPIGVRARLFAVQRELAGTRELRLGLPEGATIEDAWTDLVGRYPALGPGRPYLRFARNGEYADPSTRLSDGDEVAFIPPVSGGARSVAGDGPRAGSPPDAGASIQRIELTEGPIDDALIASLRASVAHPRVGAIVTFLGTTRETPGIPAPGEEEKAARHRGQSVESLDYEAFDELARRVIADIAAEVEQRYGVSRLAIVHRVGNVPVGEASVAIVAAAAHRSAAFDGCRYAIDELKARAPIWKAERFADGSVWVGRPVRESAGGEESR